MLLLSIPLIPLYMIPFLTQIALCNIVSPRLRMGPVSEAAKNTPSFKGDTCHFYLETRPAPPPPSDEEQAETIESIVNKCIIYDADDCIIGKLPGLGSRVPHPYLDSALEQRLSIWPDHSVPFFTLTDQWKKGINVGIPTRQFNNDTCTSENINRDNVKMKTFDCKFPCSWHYTGRASYGNVYFKDPEQEWHYPDEFNVREDGKDGNRCPLHRSVTKKY